MPLIPLCGKAIAEVPLPARAAIASGQLDNIVNLIVQRLNAIRPKLAAGELGKLLSGALGILLNTWIVSGKVKNAIRQALDNALAGDSRQSIARARQLPRLPSGSRARTGEFDALHFPPRPRTSPRQPSSDLRLPALYIRFLFPYHSRTEPVQMGNHSSKPHILWSIQIFLLLVEFPAESLIFQHFPPIFFLAERNFRGTIDRDGTFWS